MRRLVTAVLLLCVLLQACSSWKTYSGIDEAVEKGARIGSGVFIDNVDVSGMDVEQARNALRLAHKENIDKLNYTVAAGERTISISAKELPFELDYDNAILQAINTPRGKGSEPVKLSSKVIVDSQKLNNRLEEIITELNTSPSDAVYSFDSSKGDFAYTEEISGVNVDAAHVATSLERALSSRISAGIRPSVRKIEAEYTLDMARHDTSLIAEFTTSFSGSTYGKKNRVYNIVKAAQLINGITVASGEQFDINEILGKRTEENGWKLATGIRYGKYVQEAGGGVCQVSTTLYNAVLMADLEVVERWHHSWPLGYVPVGRDATISTDGPNFVFLNTTPKPITITALTDTENKTVTVRLYGRPSEEFAYIELRSWKIETIPDPGSEIKLDKTLPYGTEVIERESREGCISETYKYYFNAAGELLSKARVTKDKYRAVKGIKLVSRDIYEASIQTNATVYPPVAFDTNVTDEIVP